MLRSIVRSTPKHLLASSTKYAAPVAGLRTFSSETPAFAAADRVQGFGTSIFTEMTLLAVEHKAVNLGQGAPDFNPPDFVLKNAKHAIDNFPHQYSRSAGAIPLVNALANLYSPHFNRKVDAMNEIVVTGGATEGGCSAMLGLVNPGDEVVAFEPFYDAYPAWVKLAGGTMKHVLLKPKASTSSSSNITASDFVFDPAALAAAITPKTKVLLLNTPHNPLGKVFSFVELEAIAEIVRRNPQLTVVTDEVYDFLLHKDATKAPRFATLPGMWERTITLGSAGKMFSCTGWKIGWAIGPAHLTKALQQAHQWIIFSVATPLQLAIGNSLTEAQSNGYFSLLEEQFTHRRDILAAGLKEAGLKPYLSHAGYFLVTDVSPLAAKLGIQESDPELDRKVAVTLTKKLGVTGIPVSAFYSEQHKHMGSKYVRFAYCKSLETIEAGIKALKKPLPL